MWTIQFILCIITTPYSQGTPRTGLLVMIYQIILSQASRSCDGFHLFTYYHSLCSRQCFVVTIWLNMFHFSRNWIAQRTDAPSALSILLYFRSTQRVIFQILPKMTSYVLKHKENLILQWYKKCYFLKRCSFFPSQLTIFCASHNVLTAESCSLISASWPEFNKYRSTR